MTEPQRNDNWTGGLLVTGSRDIGYNIPDWRSGTRGYIEYQEQSPSSQNSEWVDHVYDGDDMQAFLRALLNIDMAVNCRLVSAHLVQASGEASMPGGSFGGPGGLVGQEKPQRFDDGAPSFGNFTPADTGTVASDDDEDGDGEDGGSGADDGTSGTSGTPATAPRPAPPRTKPARR